MLLRFLAIIASCLLSSPAYAQAGERAGSASDTTIELAYELFASGIILGRVDMSARLRGETYAAESRLETKGLVNAVWQARIEGGAKGRISQGRIMPEFYYAFSDHDEHMQKTQVEFGPSGAGKVIAEPEFSDADELVFDKGEKNNTLDPVSALLFAAAGPREGANACDAAAPIFDGRRRYDIALNFVRKTNVTLESGLYAGPVDVCRLRYKHIAGASQKVLEDTANLPDIFVWVAPLQVNSDRERNYYLPLRVWTETKLGVVVALVADVKVDGVTPFSPNRR